MSPYRLPDQGASQSVRRCIRMFAVIHRVIQILAVGVALSVAAWAQSASDVEAVVTTTLGSFRFEFFPDKAPKHVEQFMRLAREGYYDGSAFHRAVLNGLIQ